MDNASEEQMKLQQKAKPLKELLSSSLVDIYIGPESHRWPLHEELLCYYSPFFARIFSDESEPSRSGSSKSFTISDEDDDMPFTAIVGWLYSRSLRAPTSEKEVGTLLDVYLLAGKFEMAQLQEDVVEAVREWYHTSSTYPGLRRVQYIYENTSEDNLMREMMVSSVARQLTTGDKIPVHWAKALQRNGQLAVDIIRAIQQWHIEERSIPDARDASADRGRLSKDGFSIVEEDRGASIETVTTDGTTDTNLGVQSIGSVASDTEDKGKGKEVGRNDDGEEEWNRPQSPRSDQTAQLTSEPNVLLTKLRRQRHKIPPFMATAEFGFLTLAWLSYMAYYVFVWNQT